MQYLNTKSATIINDGTDTIRLSKDKLMAASASLTSSAFKIYIWFIAQQKDHIKLQPKDISEEIGINVNSFRNGYRLLVELGYIEVDGAEENIVFHL